MLRTQGQRAVRGASPPREDFAAAKHACLAERRRAEDELRAALDEVLANRGRLDRVRLGERARDVLLDLYAAALAAGVDGEAAAPIPGGAADLVVHATPGSGTVVASPSGRLTLVGRTLEVRREAADGIRSGPNAVEHVG